MTAKPNYFKIGIFVVVGVLLVIGGIIYFSSGVLRQQKIYFETYFQNSVSGLSVGAVLQDRGVPIGQVEKIGFASRHYLEQSEFKIRMKYAPYVLVVCSMNIKDSPIPGTPKEIATDIQRAVKHGYRWRLATNFLTGQAMIEGVFLDPNTYPPLEFPWKPDNIYIPSAPGEFSSIKDSVDKILKKIESLEIEKLLASAESALDTIKNTVIDSNVPAVTFQVRNLFAEARETNAYIQKLLITRDANQAPANIAQALEKLNLTLTHINELLSAQGPVIDQTLDNLRQASSNIKDITENLKSNPSDIIFSKPPRPMEKTK